MRPVVKQCPHKVGLIECTAADLPRYWTQTSARSRKECSNEWYGGSPTDCKREVTDGRRTALAEAKELAWEMEVASRDIESRFQVNAVVAGGAVCVPAVMAGSPLAFVRVQPAPSQAGVRIFADVGASSGFTAKQLQTRGLAVLALAQTLARTRPVELIACTVMYRERTDTWGCVRIPLGVNPIDWTAASAILGSSNVFRRLLLPLSNVANGIIDRLEEYEGAEGAGRPMRQLETPVASALGVRSQDLFLPGALWSQDQTQMQDPVGWVKARIEQIK